MLEGFLQYLRIKIAGEEPLHPIDRTAAKQWVIARLAKIFPEYAEDPQMLRRIYRSLDLRPRKGAGEGGATVFEIVLRPETDAPPPKAQEAKEEKNATSTISEVSK